VQVDIESYRIRPGDDADATLEKITQIIPNVEGAKIRAKSFLKPSTCRNRVTGCRFWTAKVLRSSPGARETIDLQGAPRSNHCCIGAQAEQ
jgi:hypothetical protein